MPRAPARQPRPQRAPKPRAARPPSALSRRIFERGLTLREAADQVLAHHARHARGAPPVKLCGPYLGAIARGEQVPRLALARAIVAWAGGTVQLGDLVDLT